MGHSAYNLSGSVMNDSVWVSTIQVIKIQSELIEISHNLVTDLIFWAKHLSPLG